MSSLKKYVAGLRKEYSSRELDETHVSRSPLVQFEKWFSEAVEAEVNEPHAMTLATAGRDRQPSARIVLLRGYSSRGFIFYTNYNSSKGTDIRENPRASINFFWPELERQLRIDGSLEKISARASDDYFNSRPRGSQLGAWASGQSAVIKDRQVILDAMKALELKYAGKTIPRPPHWGGYLLKPAAFEFWQGRFSRLHDRIRYTVSGKGKWKVERLAP